MSTENHPDSILRAMQNATDAEVARANRIHANLTASEQMYMMIKRLEADVKRLSERVAALEDWKVQHQSNHAITDHRRYGG